MKTNKMAPASGFSREASQTGTLSVQQEATSVGSMTERRQDVDRMFERALRDVRPPFDFSLDSVKIGTFLNNVLPRPTVHIASREEEVSNALEILGVDDTYVAFELAQGGTIKGENQHADEQGGKNVFCMERPYGPFPRARSKNTTLTVACGREAASQEPKRRGEMRKAA